jgi:uncharacterized secreted protein with C-terminal beta-propeller domain
LDNGRFLVVSQERNNKVYLIDSVEEKEIEISSGDEEAQIFKIHDQEFFTLSNSQITHIKLA